jgi:ethanolaminephosphotransferase
MDGKQARKTQNSTPLGSLFDHASDAFTCVISTITMARLMQCGNSMYLFNAIFFVTLQFYFATVEAFYIGGVHLPKVNGVSDGSVVYFLNCTFIAVFGELSN